MKHDLESLFSQVQATLAREYDRIRARTQEDPGTAGDQGEENWAKFLREWLPATYTVVTKGRLIDPKGNASPQLDVLVLSPAYPPVLRDTKLYLSTGVVAAFECKTTLRGDHIEKAAGTARILQRMATIDPFRPPAHTSPHDELFSGLTYGILAHSCSWAESSKISTIGAALHKSMQACSNPREILDVICVADTGTWSTSKSPYYGPGINTWDDYDPFKETFPDGYAGAYWFGPSLRNEGEINLKFPNNPLAQLCAFLTHRIAWNDTSMRPMADYFRLTGLLGHGEGSRLAWSLDATYSEAVKSQLPQRLEFRSTLWNPWSSVFF